MAARSSSQRTTERAARNGTIRSTPSSVSFWTTSSGRSPFTSANATVIAGASRAVALDRPGRLGRVAEARRPPSTGAVAEHERIAGAQRAARARGGGASAGSSCGASRSATSANGPGWSAGWAATGRALSGTPSGSATGTPRRRVPPRRRAARRAGAGPPPPRRRGRWARRTTTRTMRSPRPRRSRWGTPRPRRRNSVPVGVPRGITRSSVPSRVSNSRCAPSTACVNEIGTSHRRSKPSRTNRSCGCTRTCT